MNKIDLIVSNIRKAMNKAVEDSKDTYDNVVIKVTPDEIKELCNGSRVKTNLIQRVLDKLNCCKIGYTVVCIDKTLIIDICIGKYKPTYSLKDIMMISE